MASLLWSWDCSSQYHVVPVALLLYTLRASSKFESRPYMQLIQGAFSFTLTRLTFPGIAISFSAAHISGLVTAATAPLKQKPEHHGPSHAAVLPLQVSGTSLTAGWLRFFDRSMRMIP
ncbi:hypothetical protein VTK56DRAFT_6715 [Thermocarpiscus australiensis]